MYPERHTRRQRNETVGAREIDLADFVGKGKTYVCLRLDPNASTQHVYMTVSINAWDEEEGDKKFSASPSTSEPEPKSLIPSSESLKLKK